MIFSLVRRYRDFPSRPGTAGPRFRESKDRLTHVRDYLERIIARAGRRGHLVNVVPISPELRRHGVYRSTRTTSTAQSTAPAAPMALVMMTVLAAKDAKGGLIRPPCVLLDDAYDTCDNVGTTPIYPPDRSSRTGWTRAREGGTTTCRSLGEVRARSLSAGMLRDDDDNDDTRTRATSAAAAIGYLPRILRHWRQTLASSADDATRLSKDEV